MADSAVDELAGATGLALAAIVSLLERNEPISKGEVGRYLAHMADAADPHATKQREIRTSWATLLKRSDLAH